MQLALVLSLSTVVDQASGLAPSGPQGILTGVQATGGVGTITTSTGAGSGSPLGILLAVTKP